jgi:transposase
LKKGHRYRSILVDLEAHQVVDMLPDREADTVASWLETHPGVQVISRDRAGTYADGAARGAPDAIQVADRFHLFQNMSTTLREVLGQEDIAREAAFNPTDARFAELGTSQLAARPTPRGLPEPTAGRPEALTGTASSVMGPSPEPHPAPNRDRRRARYDDVWRLHQQGLSKAALADAVGLHRDTVAKYLGASSFPERQPRSPRPSILDPYKPYLQQRWQEGCQIGAQLFRELRA